MDIDKANRLRAAFAAQRARHQREADYIAATFPELVRDDGAVYVREANAMIYPSNHTR